MEINKIKKGVYKYTQKSYRRIQYLVTISGDSSFLQIETVFDLIDNRIVSKDKLRGKDFEIEEINLYKEDGE
jgi:hypothetical protein